MRITDTIYFNEYVKHIKNVADSLATFLSLSSKQELDYKKCMPFLLLLPKSLQA